MLKVHSLWLVETQHEIEQLILRGRQPVVVGAGVGGLQADHQTAVMLQLETRRAIPDGVALDRIGYEQAVVTRYMVNDQNAPTRRP